MAVIRYNKYPGRWLSSTTQYPQGAFKNKSSASAQDGSYAEADWLNDWAGFFGRLLVVGNVTPDGTVDNALSSQYFTALRNITVGRLNMTRQVYSTSGTFNYTPSSTDVRFVKVTVIGGGASGGGCAGNSISQTISGAGGGAGGTAIKTQAVTFGTNYPVIVGAGGASVLGANPGISGGSSSFNGTVIGGGGGFAGKNGATSTSGGAGGVATGGDDNYTGGDGQDGQNLQFLITGNGGSSYAGGGGRAGSGGGLTGKAPGSGGGGAYDGALTGTAYRSGAGQSGRVVIEEYF